MWISLKLLPSGLPSGLSNEQWGDHVQSNCRHNLLSCYFDRGAQNNWLITQYINISTTEVTDLNGSATFATSPADCAAGQCSQSVPVRVYWTNTPDETERNNISNYGTVATRLLHTTNDSQRQSDHEDVKVPLGITGMYLAFVDEGTCVSITRLVVSYNVCPEQTLNLITYPQTIAPTARTISFKMVPASCVDRASMVGTTMLVCTVGGLWSAPGPPADTCQCDPGYQMIGFGLNATCEACPPQQFKSGRSNTEACRSCPLNSYANTNGSAVCTCSAGYYRTRSETSDTPCTGPPSAPHNLTATKISQLTHASILLTWSSPSITGNRADLKYVVTYVKGVGTGSNMITMDTMATNVTLNDLEFSTLYRITVEAVNGVSMELGSSINRTVTINVTTLGQPPSAPQNLVLESRTLSWDQPTSTFGEDLLRYEILASSTEDVSTAEVLRNVSLDATSYTLTDEDLQGKTGSLYIWIIGIVFAIQTRKVKVKVLNDAKWVAAIIYSSSLGVIVIILSKFTLTGFLNTETSLMNTAVVLATTLILTLAFVPKMVSLYKDLKGVKVFRKPSNSSTIASHGIITGRKESDSEDDTSSHLCPRRDSSQESDYQEDHYNGDSSLQQSSSSASEDDDSILYRQFRALAVKELKGRQKRRRLKAFVLEEEERPVIVSTNVCNTNAIIHPVECKPAAGSENAKEKCPTEICVYKRLQQDSPWVARSTCEQWFHCRCVGLTKHKADKLPEWH